MSFHPVLGSTRRSPTSARSRGFTLVELLVVIGIIALLISILLPSLNKARQQGQMIKCLSNIRSLQMAITMYANENKQFVPAVNWGGDPTVNGKTLAGWLYQHKPAVPWEFTASNPMTIERLKQGSIYPYTGTPDVYRCPGHDPNVVIGQTDRVTSYLMNGALNGFNRRMHYKITQFKSDDTCFWEVDERAGPAFNDGSSSADETFKPESATRDAYEARHGKYACVGFIGGHAETMLHDEIVKLAKEEGIRRNMFWCVPANVSRLGHERG